MAKLRQSRIFAGWLSGLDGYSRGRVLARLKRMQEGNLGDSKPVGEGLHEARIHFGPGYRLYYTTRGSDLIWLLAGGVKNTQQADIALARKLAKEI